MLQVDETLSQLPYVVICGRIRTQKKVFATHECQRNKQTAYRPPSYGLRDERQRTHQITRTNKNSAIPAKPSHTSMALSLYPYTDQGHSRKYPHP